MRLFLAFFVFILSNFINAPAMAQSLIRDAEIENTIRGYSDPIFAAAGLNPKDVQIYIVNDKSLNAFVTDGQKMFLNTGIILDAKAPIQLKGVIAHETGHIAGGHLARSTQAERAAMVPAYISIALGIAAIAAGAPDAGAALLASSQQFALLSFFTYTRIQEASADQAALQYLEKTHQSGQGLVDFFEKFRYNEVMSDARKEPYFRSHPLSGDRILALQTKLSKSEYANTKDTQAEIDQFKMIQAKIFGFVSTSEQTYLKYNYRDNSKPSLYARAIAFYRAPDLQMAVSTLDKLLSQEPNNPYFNELMGQILFENNKSKDAIAYYEKSTQLAPKESLLYVGLARAYIAQNDKLSYEKADAALKNAIRYEPENAFAWNQLAIVADRQGKAGLARLATAEEAFFLGDFARANRFSQVAMKNLERKTPEWQRASDIRVITDPIVAKMVRKGNYN
ncbi:MAG: M48 family metallopeptidase [Caulobacterales bacterium]|nr:M48 family metallopeptidase [Caulobacterales bacterium]